jgi:hypothetical protein
MPRLSKKQQVGHRVLDNYSFLRQICRTRSAKTRERLLSEASADQLLAIVEICSNILKGTFNLTGRQRDKLVPYAQQIRQLSRSRSEQGARRRLLQQQRQTGHGLFTTLLAPILLHAAQQLIHRVAANGQ